MRCVPSKPVSIHQPTPIDIKSLRPSPMHRRKPKPGQGCTHNTGVILEVEEDTICALPWLRLADNDRGHDLLPELGLSLLDGRHDHVTDTTSGETVKTRSDTLDGDDVQVTSTRVVAAVHDGAAVFALVPLHLPSSTIQSFSVSQFDSGFVAGSIREGNVHWETEGHLQLATWGTTTVKTVSQLHPPHKTIARPRIRRKSRRFPHAVLAGVRGHTYEILAILSEVL